MTGPNDRSDNDDEWWEDTNGIAQFELDDDGDGGNLIMDGEAQHPFDEADETDDD